MGVRRTLAMVVSGLCCSIAAVHADDWPQFMGPNRNGVVEGPKLLSKWPDGGPKQVWSIPCGKGGAGPAIAGGIIVLMERYKENEGEEITRGIEAASGKELWKTGVPVTWPAKRGYTWGPCATPAIGKGKVVSLGIEGRLRCLELATGKVVWETHLAKDYGVTEQESEGWGVVTSPLVVDDLVVVQVCSKTAKVGLVAWRLEDGKEAWRTPFFANYSSSASFLRAGEVPVVISCATSPGPELRSGDLYGFDGRSGELLWSVKTGKSYYNCPTPVAGDGMVFLEGGGGDGPMVAVKLDSPTKGPAQVAWKDDKHLVRFSNCLYYKGLLFGHGYRAHGGPHLLWCDDAKDGSTCWDSQDKDNQQWLLGSDGKVLQLRENGELILFDADARAGYHELGRAKVIDNTWAHPALADGRLYVRSDTQLVCVELSGE